MKNVTKLILSIIALFMVSACQRENVNTYAGKYKGTLTADVLVKNDVGLIFRKGTDKKTLSLFDVDLIKTSENQFSADVEIMLKILHLIDADITEKMLSNASATFVFENNEVTMDMKYNLSKSVMQDPIYVRYIGKK